MLFVLFPGFGDTKARWGKPLIPMLKKLGRIYYPPDIQDVKEQSIKKYVKELNVPSDDKIILIAHSVGLWYAYEYAKINKVAGIISLDGSLIGKYVKKAVARVVLKLDALPLLLSLVKQAPLTATKFPVKTICFRNIMSGDHLKQKEIDNNKQAILEAKT